jgi:hypothetical protein
LTGTALDAYLPRVDPAAATLVIDLDKAIRKAEPKFDVAVKYGMLMYTLGGNWRTWVCAIGATNKGIALRFLYGVLLDDPRGILRAGSSVLKTWDFAVGDVVEPAAVGAYVTDAVARHDYYQANASEVLEASRVAARPSRRPKPTG